ncbi:MAG: glucokinase [Xanthomonadales bacterium]|nr:glucokinase [Xanthomonadales bacterium]
MTLLVADIGGTGARLAVMRGWQAVETREYANAHFENFDEILRDFLSHCSERPEHLAISAAGPVVDGKVDLTNLGWDLSSANIAHTFDFERVEIINDFAALAWATEHLQPTDLYQVGGGVVRANSTRVIVGPGTGLGVSALVTDGSGWIAVAGEGGHVSMAATNQRETELIDSVRAEFGHCSAERLISGPGLARMYQHISGHSCQPEEISARAFSGDKQADEAVEIFCCLLGTIASNLAVTFGAFGGVYLGGGILPTMLNRFKASGFRQRFEAKARYGNYLAAIPSWVITAKNPSFLGLYEFVRRNTDIDKDAGT